MDALVRKWALKNAVDHEGKAVPGAVIPKAIGEDNSLKEDMKTLAKKVAEVAV